MKKMVLVSLLLVFAFPFNAYPYTVNTDQGTIYNTTAIASLEVLGDTMNDMAVTAFFAAGGSQTLSWAGIPTPEYPFHKGGVSGTGWSLTARGDTGLYSSLWTLHSDNQVAISGLVIDGRPGSLTFDLTWPRPYIGTPGSGGGLTFEVQEGGTALDSATYRNLLGVNGSAPVEDLYLVLDLKFNRFTGDMTFWADTDKISILGDLTPIVPAPEPLSIVLLGLGLAGLAAFRRN